MGIGVNAQNIVNSSAVNNVAEMKTRDFNSKLQNQNDNLNDMSNLAINDPGLNVSAADRADAMRSMEGLNGILRDAAEYTGALDDGVISEGETRAMNQYIREYRQEEWNSYHGDDEGDVETGFHKIQNDGGTLNANGNDFVDGTVDSVYHMGYEIKGDNILNEDGDKNASVSDLTEYLNEAFFGDFREGMTTDAPGEDGGGKGEGAGASGGEKAGGSDETDKAGGDKEGGEKSEGVEESGESKGAGESEGAGGMSDLMELLEKLMNGELTEEEEAKLKEALGKYMKDGKLDIEALKADLEKAGMDPEKIDKMVSAAEKMVAEGDLGDTAGKTDRSIGDDYAMGGNSAFEEMSAELEQYTSDSTYFAEAS